MTRRLTLAAAGVVAALFGAGVVAAAADDAPSAVVEFDSGADPQVSPSPNVEPGPPAEREVFDAADRLATAAEYKDNGWAGLLPHPADRLIDLWWKGPIDDAEVTRVLTELRAEGRVTVHVRSAEHSRAEMRVLGEKPARSTRWMGVPILAVTEGPPPID